MRKLKGFTLIELMIVVAIIAILVAIAYPGYMSSIHRSNRAEAKSGLMDVAQRLQRCFTSLNRFDDSTTNCSVGKQLTDTGVTTIGKNYYLITAVRTQTTYTLTATAIAAPQLGDKDGVDCTQMTLTSTGIKGPTACW